MNRATIQKNAAQAERLEAARRRTKVTHKGRKSTITPKAWATRLGLTLGAYNAILSGEVSVPERVMKITERSGA